MKRAIGLPATTARAARKKRGFSLQLAAYAAGHIALRCPAPRKPWVYIHVHPLGGVKLCFTARHRRSHVPGVAFDCLVHARPLLARSGGSRCDQRRVLLPAAARDHGSRGQTGEEQPAIERRCGHRKLLPWDAERAAAAA
jgi:hypothetical protein